jgi:hypothetical protein
MGISNSEADGIQDFSDINPVASGLGGQFAVI